MDPKSANIPLTAEQRFALGQIVEKGSLVKLGDQTYLMAPVSPMMEDFLKAIRLPDYWNNLDPANQRGDKSSVQTPTAITAEERGVTVGEMLDRFLTERAGTVAPTTMITFRRVANVIREVVGADTLAKKVTREDINEVRDTIVNLPMYYPSRFKGMSMRRAIRYARENNLPTRNVTAINPHLVRVSTIFRWAEAQWLVDRNPAVRLAIRPNKSTAGFNRKPFSIEHLNIIFSAPIYSGCVDDWRNFAKPGSNKPRRERFWIPLIALFSGLRLNEICQMDVADIVKQEGVYCFHITNESEDGYSDKRTKTPAAKRFVPIHKELLEIGLLLHRDKMACEGERKLFPHLSLNRKGNYSHAISIWFTQRFMKDLGIYDRQTTFHSFRHNFRDALRRSRATVYVMKELCGWSLPNQGLEWAYGSLLTISHLKDAIDGVGYPGLDFTHIQRLGGPECELP